MNETELECLRRERAEIRTLLADVYPAEAETTPLVTLVARVLHDLVEDGHDLRELREIRQRAHAMAIGDSDGARQAFYILKGKEPS